MGRSQVLYNRTKGRYKNRVQQQQQQQEKSAPSSSAAGTPEPGRGGRPGRGFGYGGRGGFASRKGKASSHPPPLPQPSAPRQASRRSKHDESLLLANPAITGSHYYAPPPEREEESLFFAGGGAIDVASMEATLSSLSVGVRLGIPSHVAHQLKAPHAGAPTLAQASAAATRKILVPDPSIDDDQTNELSHGSLPSAPSVLGAALPHLYSEGDYNEDRDNLNQQPPRLLPASKKRQPQHNYDEADDASFSVAGDTRVKVGPDGEVEARPKPGTYSSSVFLYEPTPEDDELVDEDDSDDERRPSAAARAFGAGADLPQDQSFESDSGRDRYSLPEEIEEAPQPRKIVEKTVAAVKVARVEPVVPVRPAAPPSPIPPKTRALPPKPATPTGGTRVRPKQHNQKLAVQPVAVPAKDPLGVTAASRGGLQPPATSPLSTRVQQPPKPQPMAPAPPSPQNSPSEEDYLEDWLDQAMMSGDGRTPSMMPPPTDPTSFSVASAAASRTSFSRTTQESPSIFPRETEDESYDDYEYDDEYTGYSLGSHQVLEAHDSMSTITTSKHAFAAGTRYHSSSVRSRAPPFPEAPHGGASAGPPSVYTMDSRGQMYDDDGSSQPPVRASHEYQGTASGKKMTKRGGEDLDAWLDSVIS